MSLASNRLKLSAILAMFLLPLLVAVLMYRGQLPLFSGEPINQGTLVQPPVALDWTVAIADPALEPVEALLGSWVMLMAVPAGCDEACLQKVTGLRQVHKASGRERHRLELVLLTESLPDQSLKQRFLNIYEQFRVLADPSDKIHKSIQTALVQSGLSANGLNTYLVDPMGNIMMAYNTSDSEARMSKDLKRLLAWSKQDKG